MKLINIAKCLTPALLVVNTPKSNAFTVIPAAAPSAKIPSTLSLIGEQPRTQKPLSLAAHSSPDACGDNEFPYFTKKLQQLLGSPETISALHSDLEQQGYCELDPGLPTAFEFMNYFQKHATTSASTMRLPEDLPMTRELISLANKISGNDTDTDGPYTECSINIKFWEGGTDPQAWHQDSSEDKMVWILTGYGEPTWFLDNESAEECQLNDRDELSGATFECNIEPGDPRIKKGTVGKFLIFKGDESFDNPGRESLIHKVPGTLGQPDGRATVRIIFS